MLSTIRNAIAPVLILILLVLVFAAQAWSFSTFTGTVVSDRAFNGRDETLQLNGASTDLLISTNQRGDQLRIDMKVSLDETGIEDHWSQYN